MENTLNQFCEKILSNTIESFPKADLGRLERNIDFLLHDHGYVAQDSLQKPTFYYYRGLTDQPWWDIELISKDELMDFKNKMRQELQNMLLTSSLLSPFSVSLSDSISPSYLEGQMNTYHLIRDLDPNQGQYSKRQLDFPQTMNFLHTIPRLAEDAFFSCLTPGTHLKAHEAEDNLRLNVHLGLEIPLGSGIRVANQSRIWPEDQVLCFDPSFRHEAWNFGTSNRHVLLFTIWHPDLIEAEIYAIKLFTKGYQQYV
jgi:hypothetical protein